MEVTKTTRRNCWKREKKKTNSKNYEIMQPSNQRKTHRFAIDLTVNWVNARARVHTNMQNINPITGNMNKLVCFCSIFPFVAWIFAFDRKLPKKRLIEIIYSTGTDFAGNFRLSCCCCVCTRDKVDTQLNESNLNFILLRLVYSMDSIWILRIIPWFIIQIFNHFIISFVFYLI